MYYSICYMVCNYGGIFYGFLIPHIPIAPVHLYSMASMNDLCLYVSLFVLFRVNSYIWHIMFQCDEFIKFGLVWFAVRVVFPTAMFLHMPMALVDGLCQYVSYVMVHVNCYYQMIWVPAWCWDYEFGSFWCSMMSTTLLWNVVRILYSIFIMIMMKFV